MQRGLLNSLPPSEFEGVDGQPFLDITGLLGWPDLGHLDPKKQDLTEALVNGCPDALYELTAPESEDFAELTQRV